MGADGSQSGPFVLLQDPANYAACDWDLSVDARGREYWVGCFQRNFETTLKLAREAATARGAEVAVVGRRIDECRRDFLRHFDDFAARPDEFGTVSILTMDQWRDAILRRHGFVDAFIDLKNRENERMLPLLPRVCRELDRLDGFEQLRAVVEGVFAGNIFDMGAELTARAFADSGPDFFATRDRLPARPWLIDDFDALAGRLMNHVHRKAVFFVDNAGADFVLGAIPMMRWLALRGTVIVLAANERPSLNDMTIGDVRAWWGRIARAEPSLGELAITPVSTGTGEPLIDLSHVSAELNAAAADADLVILEGMGRGVESNLAAKFLVDALNLAMLKDPAMAERCGGKVYDLVCRFRPGGN